MSDNSNNINRTSILQWLENSTERFPDKPAFTDAVSSVTFSELQQKAKTAASVICKYAQPTTPVAFYLEKSTQAVCAMMGTVYAGCFYSFIDVRQPESRAQNVLQTLNPSIIITDKENLETLEKFSDIKYIDIDELFSNTNASARSESSNLIDENLQQRKDSVLDITPLYVNFTSGSTGNPKGVTVSHRSVIDFIPIFCRQFALTSEDSFCNQAPFDFDVSVKDIYSGLYLGATVHLIPRDYFSAPLKLMDFIFDKKPTVLVWAVSALCFVSIMKGLDYKTPDSIKTIMFSGEVMPIKQLHVWQQFLPNAKYVNLYGPTEITCNCTYYVLDRDFSDTEVIPIGKPFANEKVFLLDENNKLITEPNIQGELCVSGTCVASGYYNNKERTNESFIQNPLNPYYNETIYCTGDLAKYDENGNLIYIGRKDFQIKHMGHRIELGEIEIAAMSVDGVSRACCIYDSAKKRIILFYTGSIEKANITKQLRLKLPPFMIPSTVKQIEQMPLNKNGKIDRKALTAIYNEK
jgi:amino acid adenylation domain-containing protein